MTRHADDALFLRLAFTRGISARGAHKLLSELGDIGTLFSAGAGALSRIAGDVAARALATAPDAATGALIDAAVQAARAAPLPDPGEVLTDVYQSYPGAKS